MRFVPTRIHRIVDWLLGALLIALPWLLGFARGGPETYVPVALGSIGLLVTFFTDHEYGIVRRIPMSGHLAVDPWRAPPWQFLRGFSVLSKRSGCRISFSG